MHVWLIDFEHTAAARDVPLKVAAQSIYQYLPADISSWLHSKRSSSRMTWQQIKDTSINRYANSEAEDNKILRRRLIWLKQKETVDIRDHSSQYEHLLSLVIQPKEEDEQVKTYIDSLFTSPCA